LLQKDGASALDELAGQLEPVADRDAVVAALEVLRAAAN
jgi:hypothetical protein